MKSVASSGKNGIGRCAATAARGPERPRKWPGKSARFPTAGLVAVLLAACGGSNSSNGAVDGSGAPPQVGSVLPPTAACASPTPAGVVDQTIVVDIPSDFDTVPTTPASTINPTTSIGFSLLLPARCPGDQFPVILHSHGYGGSRLRTLAVDGDLSTLAVQPHFASIELLVKALPYHGYAVISYDERGHGDSVNANARLIDPAAEVQDAKHILDWAYDNAKTYNLQTETGTGVAKDLRVGTIGGSYGGGFQMPLAALDARIDTIVPNGTWNNLVYSFMPGDAMKMSFDALLCMGASSAWTAAVPNTGVKNTPLIAALCNAFTGQTLQSLTNRTRTDLAAILAQPTMLPRPVAATEITPFLYSHSARYFETQQASNQPWGFGETTARLRAVSALFLQGNRDALFNLTEGYWNASYFGATGADVRVLSTEGGHMNPMANQVEGPANCGKIIGITSILAWFDEKLKGVGSSDYSAIPKVCISVADTIPGQPGGTPVGLLLKTFPVGSLSGSGSVPTRAESLSVTVPPLGTTPVFAPVATISGNGRVIAGAPRIDNLTVARGFGAVQEAVAYVGIGIHRAGQLILVDEQVTPFVEGTHVSNRGVNNSVVLLPAVGEMLQDGDEVGLLFYPQQVQYSPIDPSFVALPNPYTVTATGVELPILIPGQYPSSSLSQ